MSNEELLNEICCDSSNDFDEFSLEIVNDILNQDNNFFNVNDRVVNRDEHSTSSLSAYEIDEAQLNKSVAILSSREVNSLVLICRVCGAPARGYNFDQITCESCKAFFRRNALRNMRNLRCRFNGHCEINMNNRRQCTYCRLKKCFDVKMRKDWIRTEEERQVRLLKKLHNQQKDFSLFSSEQIKSIENLSLAVRRKKRIKSVMEKQSNNQLVPKPNLVHRINTFAIHRNLSPEDGILLNNIVNAYKIGADKADFSHMSQYTSTTTLTQFLNDETIMHESLILFFKHVPEFKQNCLTDQITLIKFNIINLIHLHHTLVQDFHTPLQMGPHMSRWVSKRFHEQIVEVRNNYSCFMKYPIVLKIVLVVLIFSTYSIGSSYNTHYMDWKNKLRIIQSQNFYAELLWRYLNYIFDEHEATRAILLIVMQVLRVQALMHTLDDILRKESNPSDFNPLMKSILRFT